MAGDPVRYQKHLEYKREWNKTHSRASTVCKSCGEPKELNRMYCNKCRKAFREYSQTAYEARRKKKGFKRDNSASYKRRVEKHGRAKLALAAKVRYHLRKAEREYGHGDIYGQAGTTRSRGSNVASKGQLVPGDSSAGQVLD
jgi:ribosomal protein S14